MCDQKLFGKRQRPSSRGRRHTATAESVRTRRLRSNGGSRIPQTGQTDANHNKTLVMSHSNRFLSRNGSHFCLTRSTFPQRGLVGRRHQSQLLSEKRSAVCLERKKGKDKAFRLCQSRCQLLIQFSFNVKQKKPFV